MSNRNLPLIAVLAGLGLILREQIPGTVKK
jgi:hypothetical protein